MSNVASVGHDLMDEEHAACVRALNRLADKRDLGSLRECLAVLAEHFKDEESLLDKTMYAAVVGSPAPRGFSADKDSRKTHYADHSRLLKAMRKELSSASQTGYRVPSGFIQSLMLDFSRHADKYDKHYVGKVDAH